MALHQQQQNAAVLHSMLPADHHSSPKSPPSTWLNTSLLRQHSHHFSAPTDGAATGFLHLQTSNSDSSTSNHWLSPAGEGLKSDDVSEPINNNNAINNEESRWEREKCKADILNHPLYDQLLSAHVSCLRIATPVDQLPRIDAQLSQSQNVVAKYSVLGQGQQPVDDKDLDQFMTHYVLLLSSFKEQLQQHVRVHAMEAV
ncbi:unnamed protein product, partial [Cuscuta epithymum]